jgi:hypothetical protein
MRFEASGWPLVAWLRGRNVRERRERQGAIDTGVDAGLERNLTRGNIDATQYQSTDRRLEYVQNLPNARQKEKERESVCVCVSECSSHCASSRSNHHDCNTNLAIDSNARAVHGTVVRVDELTLGCNRRASSDAAIGRIDAYQ